jgi:hypothetical protein
MDAVCLHHETILHRVEHLEKSDEDKEERIRSLEKDRWKQAGYSGIVSGVITAVAMIIVALLKGGLQ